MMLLMMITVVLNEHITEKPFYDTTHQMPDGLMALLLVYPMILSMIVKSVKSEVVFLAWLVTFVEMVVLIAVQNQSNLSIGSFVAISFISFIALYEYQRQKISMFFLSQELRGTQTENERLEKENRASELKHLIGNVAHDLKTVNCVLC
jgi:hypothetical protein